MANNALSFCILTTFYPPLHFGGDGIDVQNMARALARRGHRVTVIHDIDAYTWLSGESLPDQPRIQDGVEVIGLRSRLGVVAPLLTHQFGRPVVHGRAIDRLIDERSPDVVLFGNVSLVGGPELLKPRGNALRVYTALEHWLVCPTHVLWRFNREPCDAQSCTRCVLVQGRPLQMWRYTGALERRVADVDLFIARSEFSRAKHREFGFQQPMQVVPCFVPGDHPGEHKPPTSIRPQQRPYFLSVGRLERIKGLDTVIPAMRRFPETDWLIVGEGAEKTALQAAAADLPNIKFLGQLPHADLRRFYEHAVALIMPSTGYETFGIVLVEAFRFHTPVIARRIGPFPEIVGKANGGLLFSTLDELTSAMTRMLTEPGLRETLADNAYRASVDHWSEHIVMNRLLDLIASARAAKVG